MSWWWARADSGTSVRRKTWGTATTARTTTTAATATIGAQRRDGRGAAGAGVALLPAVTGSASRSRMPAAASPAASVPSPRGTNGLMPADPASSMRSASVAASRSTESSIPAAALWYCSNEVPRQRDLGGAPVVALHVGRLHVGHAVDVAVDEPHLVAAQLGHLLVEALVQRAAAAEAATAAISVTRSRDRSEDVSLART